MARTIRLLAATVKPLKLEFPNRETSFILWSHYDKILAKLDHQKAAVVIFQTKGHKKLATLRSVLLIVEEGSYKSKSVCVQNKGITYCT